LSISNHPALTPSCEKTTSCGLETFEAYRRFLGCHSEGSFYHIFSVERETHPPLGARAKVNHGVEFIATRNHRNKTAPSGWMMLVLLLFFLGLDVSVENLAVLTGEDRYL